jgi:hypothetical protein
MTSQNDIPADLIAPDHRAMIRERTIKDMLFRACERAFEKSKPIRLDGTREEVRKYRIALGIASSNTDVIVLDSISTVHLESCVTDCRHPHIPHLLMKMLGMLFSGSHMDQTWASSEMRRVVHYGWTVVESAKKLPTLEALFADVYVNGLVGMVPRKDWHSVT